LLGQAERGREALVALTALIPPDGAGIVTLLSPFNPERIIRDGIGTFKTRHPDGCRCGRYSYLAPQAAVATNVLARRRLPLHSFVRSTFGAIINRALGACSHM
jgi:hypothetical protein